MILFHSETEFLYNYNIEDLKSQKWVLAVIGFLKKWKKNSTKAILFVGWNFQLILIAKMSNLS